MEDITINFGYILQAMEKQFIKIGGAGIAGLTAAINLAKAGFKVVVFEKHKKVGERHHGDFEGIENWTTKENALDVLAKFNINLRDKETRQGLSFKPWHKVSIYSPNSQKYEFISKDPLFYLIKRGPYKDCFDQYLKRQAERLGVKFELGKKVNKEDVDIVAFGHGKRFFGLAFGIIFKTDLDDSVIVILDDNLSPKAYSYLIAVKGEAVLVTCLTQDYERYGNYFEKTLQRFKSLMKFKIENPKNFGCVAKADIMPPQDKIYIGEAAGFQDALWGFGMRYAMLSGYLAARTIIENKNYWQDIKKNIHPLLKAGIVNRFIWERLGNKGYIKLLDKMRSVKDIREKVYYHHQFNIFRKILFPLAKFILKKNLFQRSY